RRPPPLPTLLPYTTLFRSSAIANQRFQHVTIAVSLATPIIVDIDIKLPLNTLRDIPVRLAVARKVDDLPSQNLTPIFRRSYPGRSEEHTSELQSRENLVCR